MNWYYVLNGQRLGPVPETQLDELARAGSIKADTLVWAEGMPNWVPYSQVRMGGTPGQPPVITPVQGGFYGTQPSSDEAARRAVQGPAIGLIVTGALGALISVANLFQAIFAGAAQREELRRAFAEVPPEFQHWQNYIEMMLGPVGLALAGFGLLVTLFTLFSGIQMQRLRNYWMPMTAAILSILSCFSGCCCLSLPIGIWAVVVLARPEVKAAFR